MDERIYGLRKKALSDGNPILRDKSFEILLETVKELKPKSILEVGTNVGVSSVSMLLACGNAHLTGIEIEEDKVRQAKENFKEFGVEDRAKIFTGDASEIIPLLSGKYDFIFLDGPKGHYYEHALNLLPLLNKGGILFADNVLFKGYVFGRVKVPKRHNTIKNSMERFLGLVSDKSKFDTEILDIEDGLSITKKLYD